VKDTLAENRTRTTICMDKSTLALIEEERKKTGKTKSAWIELALIEKLSRIRKMRKEEKL